MLPWQAQVDSHHVPGSSQVASCWQKLLPHSFYPPFSFEHQFTSDDIFLSIPGLVSIHLLSTRKCLFSCKGQRLLLVKVIYHLPLMFMYKPELMITSIIIWKIKILTKKRQTLKFQWRPFSKQPRANKYGFKPLTRWFLQALLSIKNV